MERYFYEDPKLAWKERETAYLIYDRIRGINQPSKAIASANELDVAERIVRLLNADARMVEKQGGKVA